MLWFQPEGPVPLGRRVGARALSCRLGVVGVVAAAAPGEVPGGAVPRTLAQVRGCGNRRRQDSRTVRQLSDLSLPQAAEMTLPRAPPAYAESSRRFASS